MDLKAQIKHDIESHKPMGCYDLQGSINVIDFVAMVDDDNEDEAGYNVEDGIATINIRGLLVPTMSRDYSDWGITGYNHIAEYIERANADSSVTAIVLDIDSGGGYVAGIDVPTEAIYQSEKPIETFASGDMYSAAYWLGATADSVTATKTSGVGSIGVIAMHYEFSKSLEQEGVTPTFVRSGKWKAVFNSTEPLTDEQVTRLQADVNESASIFYNHVAASRNLEAKTIAALEGDIFNAQKAKDLGLIDLIESHPSTATQQIPSMSQEDNMDLTAALAENKELKAQLSAKDTEIKELQSAKRDEAITALADKSGQTFTDDQIKAFKAMDDGAFAVTASFVPAKAEDKRKLPDGLFIDQATQGATQANADDLDANINKWAKGA